MRDNRITIRLSERLMALLKEQSHREKQTVSELVRAVLDRNLTRSPGAAAS